MAKRAEYPITYASMYCARLGSGRMLNISVLSAQKHCISVVNLADSRVPNRISLERNDKGYIWMINVIFGLFPAFIDFHSKRVGAEKRLPEYMIMFVKCSVHERSPFSQKMLFVINSLCDPVLFV